MRLDISYKVGHGWKAIVAVFAKVKGKARQNRDSRRDSKDNR